MSIDTNLPTYLDGFLDAIAIFQDSKISSYYGFYTLSDRFSEQTIRSKLAEKYDADDLECHLIAEDVNIPKFMDVELCKLLDGIEKNVRFELVWKIIEVFRVITDDFKATSVRKLTTKFDEFDGFIYVIEIDDEMLVMQVLKRKGIVAVKPENLTS